MIESLLGLLAEPLEWVLDRIGAGRTATLEHDRALFKKAAAAVGERFDKLGALDLFVRRHFFMSPGGNVLRLYPARLGRTR